MDILENAKITKHATYFINVRDLEGETRKEYINIYEITNGKIYEYWYCAQNSGNLHFAVGGEKPITDKSTLKHYIDKDLLEMDI